MREINNYFMTCEKKRTDFLPKPSNRRIRQITPCGQVKTLLPQFSIASIDHSSPSAFVLNLLVFYYKYRQE